MKVDETKEMYLEAIYLLALENENVRAVDVAKAMGYTKPSISVAIKKLKGEGYLETDDHGFICLTEKGLDVSKPLYLRHMIIAEILMAMGVNKGTAYEDSCKIEHDLSDESFSAICRYFGKYPEKG